eukprot:gb/GEZN01015212.1/.p1 GENE.gb/GEZN01015212.1/~~gb/GEZN01015212.1/.p1  ORF type:complete len:151 (-),score=21.07 gb/GEZN01015212.1/:431-883(-)
MWRLSCFCLHKLILPLDAATGPWVDDAKDEAPEDRDWDEMSEEEWDQKLGKTPIDDSFLRDPEWVDDYMKRVWADIKLNPFIPIGMFLTTVALTGGVRSLIRRERHHYQYWMRRRILAQGVTIMLVIATVQYKQNKKDEEAERTAQGFSW